MRASWQSRPSVMTPGTFGLGGAGFDAHMEKPITLAKLNEIAERFRLTDARHRGHAAAENRAHRSRPAHFKLKYPAAPVVLAYPPLAAATRRG